MPKPVGFTRAGQNWPAFVKAWPFVPVPTRDAILWCLHRERSMPATDCLIDNADGLIECAFEDCDGSALDLAPEPWSTDGADKKRLS